MEESGRSKENIPFSKPNKNGNVWPRQYCPGFSPRENATMIECWYCKYADFHLNQPKALDIGICNFPNEMIGCSNT